MTSITSRLVAGLFATTKVYGFVRLRLIFDWGQRRHLMGTIAKWLVCASAATAPEIGLAGFDIDRMGCFARNYCFAHDGFL
jgi:hypothetical protein